MRWISIIVPLFFGQPLSGQVTSDLYSLDSSKKFAHYLFIKGDLDYAADEYVRIIYLQPDDDTSLVRLSSIYRKKGQFDKAYQLLETYRADQIFGHSLLEKEYLATLLFKGSSQIFQQALNKSRTLPESEKLRMAIEDHLLQREWTSANSKLKTAPAGAWNDHYQSTSEKALAFRRKSPLLAATMSAIIPGSGKIYAKNTKEGITSFLFVAALGYQSYRAFSKRGSKSAAGWIYGGLTLGFYFGNIYGAQQSAKNYNQRQLSTFNREVDTIIRRRYP